MNVGERIKQLRSDRNLTQPQLAEAVGIEQSYLSKLENDKSLPSADIFQALLKALTVDVGTFLEAIDESIVYRQLRQIPEVANHLNANAAHSIHKIKKWLYHSAIACVIGLSLMVAGYKGLIFSGDQYYYFSEGIVLPNESKDIFGNWSLQFLTISSDVNDPRNVKAKEMFARKNEDFLVIHEYRGDKFNVPVIDGSRTYSLVNKIEAMRTENRWIIFSGVLLAVSGVFGFFIEYRLRKISKFGV
jgi:transcriptional regulator with XRE-family HTH domain